MLIESSFVVDFNIGRKEIFNNKVMFRLVASLTNGDNIELFEFLEETEETLIPKKYSFHWQDAQGVLVERWDDAPHHRELENFPHHIHLCNGLIKPNDFIPTILDFLARIESAF